jgi:Domain of unknown function (DUF5122) beta-propeller
VSPTRRPRPSARLLVPAAVLGLTVALTAVPAQAVFVPPAAPATLTSPNPVDWTPQVHDGSVRAFAQIGSTIYAGGSFSQVKNAGASTWTKRAYLFAYDAATGALKAGFAPVLDNAVQALAVSPDNKLIVGGNFATVNGVSRKNLVELDPGTGATVAGWVGRADGGVVRRIIVHGSRTYIAGGFHWVDGQAHSLLARLNSSTGDVDPGFQVDASGARPYPNSTELVWAAALSPDGATLVATGDFTQVNGQHRDQVVMVDVSGTPTVVNWATDRYAAACYSKTFPFYARDVDFSDDGSYFVIAADGGAGDAYCDAVARWETADRGANVAATWVDFTGTDSITSLEAADGLVYVGGHFRWLNNANASDKKGDGGVDRYGFGALDASNGLPVSWNPGRSPGSQLPADGTDWGPVVWEMWRGANGVYIGQDSDGVGNEYHGREALFPRAGGRTIPVQDAPPAAAGYLYLGAGNGKLTKVAFDGSTLGTPSSTSQPNLTSARAAFMVSDKLYWVKLDSTAPKGATLDVSGVSGGTVGAPWVGSGFNSWFSAGNMTGAFYLRGRMYYTTSGGNALYYRYLTPDGSLIGCTVFTLPTSGVTWTSVRGMTWVNGRIVYGSTDGTLRSVAFDPGATTAVVGSTAKVVASGTAAATWNNPTLFFNAS